MLRFVFYSLPSPSCTVIFSRVLSTRERRTDTHKKRKVNSLKEGSTVAALGADGLLSNESLQAWRTSLPTKLPLFVFHVFHFSYITSLFFVTCDLLAHVTLLFCVCRVPFFFFSCVSPHSFSLSFCLRICSLTRTAALL